MAIDGISLAVSLREPFGCAQGRLRDRRIFSAEIELRERDPSLGSG
jgi:hypothetical protein